MFFVSTRFLQLNEEDAAEFAEVHQFVNLRRQVRKFGRQLDSVAVHSLSFYFGEDLPISSFLCVQLLSYFQKLYLCAKFEI